MLSFKVLMRDWLKENFPQYKAGQAYEIIGIFLPTSGPEWRWGGGQWVASMRLDGATKLKVWHRPGRTGTEQIVVHYLNITDCDVFTKLHAVLAVAEPRQETLWMWEPILNE